MPTAAASAGPRQPLGAGQHTAEDAGDTGGTRQQQESATRTPCSVSAWTASPDRQPIERILARGVSIFVTKGDRTSGMDGAYRPPGSSRRELAGPDMPPAAHSTFPDASSLERARRRRPNAVRRGTSPLRQGFRISSRPKPSSPSATPPPDQTIHPRGKPPAGPWNRGRPARHAGPPACPNPEVSRRNP